MDINNPSQLFLFRPTDILEHPTDFPTEDVPLGPIEGWLAFAPTLKGDDSKIIGPFQPVVQKDVDFDGKRYFINSGEYRFFLQTDGSYSYGHHNVVCWYQSGFTLRFIKER